MLEPDALRYEHNHILGLLRSINPPLYFEPNKLTEGLPPGAAHPAAQSAEQADEAIVHPHQLTHLQVVAVRGRTCSRCTNKSCFDVRSKIDSAPPITSLLAIV